MARYHDIDASLWEELLDTPKNQKLLYIYLFSNPSCRPSGLYKISQKTIKHHTETTESDLKGLCGGLIEYDFETQEVFVRGKFKRILSGFKNNEKMRLAVSHDFDNLSSNALKHLFITKYEGALEGLVSPPLPLPLPLALPKEGVGDKKTVVEKKDFIQSLRDNPAYKHINLDAEFGKMDAWLSIPKNRNRKKTPQFILNWVNKIEAPMNTPKPYTPPPKDKTVEQMEQWKKESAPMPEECREQLKKFGIKSAV